MKNWIAIYELVLKETVMLPRRTSTCQSTPSWQERTCPIFMSPRPRGLSSHNATEETVCRRHFYWCLTNKGCQYLRDYHHLPPGVVCATLHHSHPETGRPGRKGWRASGPQDSPETSMDRLPSQQQNSTSEADVVVNLASQLRLEGIVLC
ncbi:40S ribosomal protein S10-like [Equus quagga]|uniref:40S ribosomal protein S10-like n=1 Tax=Equus quagga TaxID=89248 RepID=UPI001EE34CBA|nr:40S ribosomal protein S10-like [Equus quagga]